MATYILLANFTEQGLRNVKDTTKRADAVKEAGKKLGVNMKEIYWTMGPYDIVVVAEAPDDASISAYALATGMAGNIRGQTLRAYSRDEMNAVLTRIA
ncbi:MAG: GYD domain-containing protein [Burkholderiales bacterium]